MDAYRREASSGSGTGLAVAWRMTGVPGHPLHTRASTNSLSGKRRAAPEFPDPLEGQERRRRFLGAFGSPLYAGNRVDMLLDGPETYHAMFEAIEQAGDHVNIESYIVEPEGPGLALADRLIACCRRGVRVNMLFDGFGCFGTPARFFTRLQDAGVRLCEYNPLHRLTSWLNGALHLRDHRKLMVVDGRVGFIGGINFTSRYQAGSAGRASVAGASAAEEGRTVPGWRDTHVRVEGPAVAHLQRLFVAHWQRFADTPMHPGHHFPPLAAAGPLRVAVTAAEVGPARNPFVRALMAAIGQARHRVLLTCAYFVPTPRLLHALTAAAGRGVEVRLVLPGVSDSWMPLHAAHSHYAQLIRSGVHIHELHDSLLHAKTGVIDGIWSSVGSSNLDWRSFLHNAEADLIVLDPGFATRLEAVFWGDVARCTEVSIERWARRGAWKRAAEQLARRFEVYL